MSPGGEDLTSIVHAAFDTDDFYQTRSDKRPIANEGVQTSHEVSTRLYARSDGQSPRDPQTKPIVVRMSGYCGFCNAAIWQWVNRKGIQP